MKPIMETQDVARLELAIDAGGISVYELMLRAGHALAEAVCTCSGVKHIVVLAGFGNNGGDGWVAAEELIQHDLQVVVISPAEPSALKGELAPRVARSATEAGVQVCVNPKAPKVCELLQLADVVIDAMLGTGFSGSMREPFKTWTECLRNVQKTRDFTVVAADVPSGLSAQTGFAGTPAVKADTTVTMITLKCGLLADDARDLCGHVLIAPLVDLTHDLLTKIPPAAWALEKKDYRKILPESSLGADKFSRGTVLVVAGSSRYPGAAVLASRAAARMGAGYVTLAAPSSAAAAARSHLLEVPVVALREDPDGFISEEAVDQVLVLAKRASCVLVGPGLGTAEGSRLLVQTLLNADIPLVIDADGLNCCALLGADKLFASDVCSKRKAPVVLTPHARELERLTNGDIHTSDSLIERIEAAKKLIKNSTLLSFTVVSKSSATVCVGASGIYVPKPGPGALATAGSGDVLAGMMASALAQADPDTSDYTLLAAAVSEIHGISGYLAQKNVGCHAVMATDVIECIGHARDNFEAQVVEE